MIDDSAYKKNRIYTSQSLREMCKQITFSTGLSDEAKIATFCSGSAAKITHFLPISPLFKSTGDLWSKEKKDSKGRLSNFRRTCTNVKYKILVNQGNDSKDSLFLAGRGVKTMAQ